MTTTWFITGGSSGFGRALAERLLERGDRVAATARDVRSLDDLATGYGEALWRAPLDVSDAAAVREVVDRSFRELGRIDVAVANAGYGLFGAAEELTDEQIRRQLDTNLLGSIAFVRALLPHLRAQGGGRIVQMSSEGGQIAYPNFGCYHASKWGIEGFVEAVAQEVAPFGIEFTIVEPGPTRTSFGANIDGPPAMPEYDATPSGEMRRTLASGTFGAYAELDASVPAILEAAARTPAPRRLVLGRGVYERIRAALLERLAELDAQRDVALSIGG